VGDTTRLSELVSAFGVALRPQDRALVGTCGRCGEQFTVDPDDDRWACGCGSGDVVELVSVFGGVSVSHAAELLRSGWMPDGPSGSVVRTTVRQLPLLCDPEADDEALINAVLAHYRDERRASEPARAWLADLGVDDDLADELGVGLANRTLGYRLPEANRRDGAILRDKLTALGIYRSSGHEHFRGCVVVPIFSAEGRVLQLCGVRLAQPAGEPQWASGMPGGIFNEGAATTFAELIVVGSVTDALAVRGAGQAAVVAPGRPGGFHRSALRLLGRSGVQRCVVVGDDLGSLVEHLEPEGVACAVISPGAPLSALLRRASDRAGALAALLDSAHPLTRTNEHVDHRPTQEAPVAGEAGVDGGPQVNGDASELHVSIGTRHWRVRGADRNKAPDVLRVALAVTDERSGGFHLDTLDLCQAKARSAFVDAAASELHAERPVLVRELAEVLFATEAAVTARDAAGPVPEMTDAERDAALALLCDRDLTGRVVEDLGCLGIVGEETNLLVAYLATVSRKAERPFGVVIQSSTAAGKSTLADAVCQLVPEEDLASYSAVTGQALYYVGAADLAHKVLAVAEEQGAARAAYALKLLVTEGRLSIASTGKDAATGKLRTRSYEVAGPVALMLTTTTTDIDPELANRLVVLGVDEDQAQTRAIHGAQRRAATLEGLVSRLQREQIIAVHRNAQRLLEPLPVVIPDTEMISFPDTATRHRRDHQKLLSLICASALLHQHQRTIGTVEVADRSVRYVEASAADVALGMRLAEKVLARGGDDLAPQTRRLLAAASSQVLARSEAQDLDPATVSFTRRELRELLGWSEHQVRMGLARLVALEYLVAVSAGVGRQHRYLLADPPPPRETPRPVREGGSRGVEATHAARTVDPAVASRAFGDGEREAVSVGAPPRADGDVGRRSIRGDGP
jgi:DNA primase